jgi:ElaB/YqjD/DUF883 family membrane-anchored ribosome-binding protein
MQPDSTSSAESSAATSSKPPATPLSESAFLTKQAADAKAAMSRVISDVKHELAQGADPREWMQVHPWATMGVAAVAGFLAASVLVPSEEDQALKRLAAIEKALTPHLPHNGDTSSNGDSASKVASGRKSFLSGLAGQVIHAVKPALMSALTAGVTAKSVGPDNADASAPPSAPPPPGDMPSV